VKLQIESESRIVDQLVAFDFNHYMDPVTPYELVVGDKPLCERQRLYYGYLKLFVPENESWKKYREPVGCPPLTERFCYQ
jgi:hypothetical protein